MGRLIDADKLSADMYHEAFEKDSDMQKWDSGCWIRYKMFENVLKAQPTVEAPDINVGSMDTTTHDSIPAETGKNDEDRTSGDCISRTQAIDMIKEICEWHDSVTKERIIEHFKQLPSAQPDIIRCKDCKYYKYGICMKIGANKSFYGFCDWAERGEQNG